jgi:hypothetical protein
LAQRPQVPNLTPPPHISLPPIYNIANPIPTTPATTPNPIPPRLPAAPVALAVSAELELELVFKTATLELFVEEVVYNTVLLLFEVTIHAAELVVLAPNEADVVLAMEDEVVAVSTLVVGVGVVEGEDVVDVVASCWKLAPARLVVVGAAAAASVVDAASGTTTATGVDSAARMGLGVFEDGAATVSATGVDAELEVPKLLDAVTDWPLATGTSFTITTSPFTLVTLTSTVAVPNPLEFWKKL